MNGSFMMGYNVVGAISAGIDPYFAVDRAAIVVFFVMPVAVRFLYIATSKLISKLRSKTVNQEVVKGPVIPPFLIFSALLSLANLLLAIADPSSPWLADRVLMFCILLFNHLGEVQKLRKRMIADEQLRVRRVFAQPSISAAAVVSVADEAGEAMVTTPYRAQEQSTHEQQTTITDEVAADTPLHDDSPASTNSKDDLPDEVYVERLKKFMDATRVVLWVQVSATFLVVIIAEIVLSMVLYQQTGTPTAWCAPFSFWDLNKGFQVVLDYFL